MTLARRGSGAHAVTLMIIVLSAVATTGCTTSTWRPGAAPMRSQQSSDGNHERTTITAGIAPGRASNSGGFGTDIPTFDASRAHVAIEHTINEGVGVGIRGAVINSNWNLLDDVAATNTTFGFTSVYSHLSMLHESSSMRTPIRIGPEFRSHRLDLGVGPAGEVDYRCYGAAIELEPEWTFVNSGDFAASIYSRMHLGGGWVTIDGADQDDTSTASNLEAEVGLRLQASHFTFGIGALAQQTRYRDSKARNGARIPEAEYAFRGVFISFGALW